MNSVGAVLTAGCNMSCSYCYQNTKKSASISWADLRAAVDLLSGASGRRPHLVFYGGEPLLEFAKIRRAVLHAEGDLAPGMRLRYSLTTNGLLLSREVAGFLAEHRVDTQLSFDGVRAAQRRRQPGTFQRLDDLLKRLRREQPTFFIDQLGVSVAVTGANLPWFADSVDYLLARGVRRIRVGAMLTADPDWRADCTAELDRQFRRVFDISKRHFEDTGEVPVQLLRTDRRRARPPGPIPLCGLGRNGITVDVDGSLIACGVFAPSFQSFAAPLIRRAARLLRVGHVTDPDLPERLAALQERVASLDLVADKRRKYSSYGKCGDCSYVTSCFTCPAALGREPGVVDPHRVPDHQCAFQRTAARYREIFPHQPSPEEIVMAAAARGMAARRAGG